MPTDDKPRARHGHRTPQATGLAYRIFQCAERGTNSKEFVNSHLTKDRPYLFPELKRDRSHPDAPTFMHFKNSEDETKLEAKREKRK